MYGLDFFGAESQPKAIAHKVPWSSVAVSSAAGVVGLLAWRKHPVLGFLGASALASNIQAYTNKERHWKEVGRRMGCHLLAIGGSLAVPKYPAWGYIGGAVAGDLLFDDEGRGIVEEWARYAGVEDKPETIEVIPISNAKTLVKS